MVQWRDIPGFESMYQVSSEGQVRSLPRDVVVVSTGRKYRTQGKVLALGITGGGYKVATLSVGGKKTSFLVHSLVAQVFIGPRPSGLEACHNNGDLNDNGVENVRWGTHSSNVLDSVLQGTHTQLSKTHCPQGHLLQAPNLRNGYGRKCLSCSRAHSNVRNHPGMDFQERSDFHYAQLTRISF